MQRLNDNICPKCHQPLDETLLENRAASWKLSCRRCNFQKFKCYCPKCNSSIETTNPNLIADGFRLTCPSSDCQNQFQVIKCPHPDCKKFNFFNNGSYSMGELVRCRNCQTAFQQLTCPHCLEPNYWRGDVDNFYASGNVTQCYACQRKFQHLQCPHCKQPKYFKNCEYIGGIKQACDGCTRNFQHSLCSTCHTPNYYPQCNFKYGTKQVCCNNQCKQEFELVICPDCAKENLFKQNLDQGAPALKEYNCWNCKSKFSHCLCKFCQDSIYPRTDSDFRNGSNIIQCPSCKKNIPDFFKCDRCTKVSTDAKDCRFCPPKPAIPFREINIFSRPQESNNRALPNNSARSSIFNVESPSFYPPADPNASVFNRLSRVPLPSSGNNQNNNRISSIFGGGQPTFQTVPTFNQRPNTTQNASKPENVKTITKEQKKPEPEPQNLEEGKTCVICFSQPSDMAFIPCGHKKTCTECSNKIMQGNRSCPICRKPIQNCMKIFE